MLEKHQFGIEPITCHAWNRDRTQLALSLNDQNVEIYKFAGGRWTKTHELTEHQQRVTGIDWAANSNRIVTCGADRNAYVWNLENDQWRPTLVILRINRAATSVKWSPMENKFAVASGARVISVCYFEKENDWWVSKHIKKPIRSTITSLDWHPNNILIGCGSTDFKARVFSGYVKEIEDKPAATSWGKKMTFGNCMVEFSNGGGGWVHSVSFSASGEKLAWVGHDASVSVVNAANDMSMVTLKTQQLPFMSCLWLTENSLLVAGHGCVPMLFTYDGSKIVFVNKLEEENKQADEQKMSAMQRFRSMDKRATANAEEVSMNTTHQNTITQLGTYSGDKSNTAKFSSTGVDGQLVIWDIRSLEASIAGLRIV